MAIEINNKPIYLEDSDAPESFQEQQERLTVSSEFIAESPEELLKTLIEDGLSEAEAQGTAYPEPLPGLGPPSIELPDHKGLRDYDEVNRESPACFLTGQAGTGKTYLLRQHIERDPGFGVLAATTGIAAINLGAGTPTIHSLLGFGSTEGAEDAYSSGSMLRKIRLIGDMGYRWIIVDEMSMLHYRVLQAILMGIDGYNDTYEGRQVMGLMLVGDFCQLPPVPGELYQGGKVVMSKQHKPVKEPTPWTFKADCWPRFEQNIVKLTEVRRQSDVLFIEALNAARRGDGARTVELLKAAGANFKHLMNNSFDGTTIVATNDEVNRFNNLCLTKITGEEFWLTSERWYAKQYEPSEWKNVPDKAKYKVGSLVMILQNDQAAKGMPRRYVNGDLGHVVKVHRHESNTEEDPFDIGPNDLVAANKDGEVHAIEVKLLRTDETVVITKVSRPTYQLNEPDMDYIPPGPHKNRIYRGKVPGMQRSVWILGELSYFPLRSAYATTVHKCCMKGTLIPIIGKGLLPIEQVTPGDVTPYGKVKAVAESFRPAYQITTSRGYTVTSSPWHRWLLDKGLAQTSEIAEGSKIEMAQAFHLSGTEEVGTEEAWALGVLVGDGYFAHEDHHIELTNEDTYIRYRFRTYLESQGQTVNKTKENRVRCQSKQFRQRLQALGLEYVKSHDKRIPDSILRSGAKVWGAFLGGLYDADGSVSEKRVCLTTVSKDLAEQVQLVLLYLGIPSKRRVFNTGWKGTGGLYYQVSVAPAYMPKFFREVAISHPGKKAKAEEYNQANYNRVLKPFDGFDTVESVVDLETGVDMFDIELEAEPHLCAFGPFIGHNSQGLSLDAVQINPDAHFFGNPQMAYVALSRCRTAKGLTIVGGEKKLIGKINSDPALGRWL